MYEQNPSMQSKARAQVALDVATKLAFIAVCAALIRVAWNDSHAPMVVRPTPPVPTMRRPEPPLPVEPVSLDGAELRGSGTARVAMIEYSEFKCPYCGAFARDTFPAVDAQYLATGKVLLAFREFPLSVHPFAQTAAEAAKCAGAQGKFWLLHDALFRSQQDLDAPSLAKRAQAVGLEMKEFNRCTAGAFSDRVKQDIEGGKALLVTGTPTFFIGAIRPDGKVQVSQRMTGALPLGQFQAALDYALTNQK